MYEQTSETTATIRTSKVLFFLDSGELGLPEHAQMLEDFKDENKLQVFESLLDANPNTAYSQYLSIYQTP